MGDSMEVLDKIIEWAEAILPKSADKAVLLDSLRKCRVELDRLFAIAVRRGELDFSYMASNPAAKALAETAATALKTIAELEDASAKTSQQGDAEQATDPDPAVEAESTTSEIPPPMQLTAASMIKTMQAAGSPPGAILNTVEASGLPIDDEAKALIEAMSSQQSSPESQEPQAATE